jgi:hypothetical protein
MWLEPRPKNCFSTCISCVQTMRPIATDGSRALRPADDNCSPTNTPARSAQRIWQGIVTPGVTPAGIGAGEGIRTLPNLGNVVPLLTVPRAITSFRRRSSFE